MKWIILSAIVVAVIGISFIFTTKSTNNVCKTFEDYYSDRDKNENCFYNPDHNLTVSKIIQRHGYTVEEHDVITEDGYILTVFHILPRKDLNKLPRKTIFMQHGIGTNSGCFVMIGKKSLAFILADNGHDIWLGNFRGTRYSSRHKHLNVTDIKFWDFSIHEHGVYDVPAQLDFVRNFTKANITYIGYSMGATALYIYQTTYPELVAEKIEMFINLAPAVFLEQSRTVGKYVFPLWYLVKPFINILSNGRVYVKHYTIIPPWLFNYVCFPYPFQMKLCYFFDNILFGFNYEQNDPETFPVSLLNIPDATSIRCVTHLVQLSQSKHFRNYDHGITMNKQIYGSEEPPIYDLSKVKIPNHFIRGENDLMISKENVEKLYHTLPKEVRPKEIYVIDNKSFNHFDFVLAKDVIPLLYNHIVAFLEIQ